MIEFGSLSIPMSPRRGLPCRADLACTWIERVWPDDSLAELERAGIEREAHELLRHGYVHRELADEAAWSAYGAGAGIFGRLSDAEVGAARRRGLAAARARRTVRDR